MPDVNSDPRFVGFFGRMLARAPFVDAALLSSLPADNFNTARAVQALRLVLAFAVPIALTAELRAVLHIEGHIATGILAVGVASIAPLIYHLEGLVAREIVIVGATSKSWWGTFGESLTLLPRVTTILVSAVLLALTAALVAYAVDINFRHRKNWEERNAVHIQAAHAAFDISIAPQKQVVENITATLRNLDVVPAAADTSIETAEITRLNTLIAELGRQLAKLDEDRIRLAEKQRCEGGGFQCFGGSGAFGQGKRFKELGYEIAEKDGQIKRLRVDIDMHVKERDALVQRRDGMIPSAEAAEKINNQREDLRARLVTAQRALAAVEAKRAAFVDKMVPFEPAGPLEQLDILVQELRLRPINAAYTGVWAVWLASLEMALVTSAFALRKSEYGIQLRRRLARASAEAEIEKAESSASIKIAVERLKQAKLTEELRTIIQRRRNETLKGENDDFAEAAE